MREVTHEHKVGYRAGMHDAARLLDGAAGKLGDRALGEEHLRAIAKALRDATNQEVE